MKGRKEIAITNELRGRVVFAKAPKGKRAYFHDWLLLIDKVGPDEVMPEKTNPIVYTHVSYDVESHATYLSDCPRWGWPDEMGYKFYTMKDDEKEIIKKILKDRNLRFVKGINKVIKR
jgi:hypothetical protein